MRITIMGGSGFVGQTLCRQLLAAGHQVQILSRQAARQRALLLHQGVSLVQPCQYTAEALAPVLKHSDAVINLVGILNERGRSGEGFERAHVGLTQELTQACQQAGVRRYLHMSALRAGEGRSHYLLSKGRAEAMVHAAQQTGNLDTTIFQPSVIFGAGDGFILRFAQLLKLSPVFPLACPQARFQPVWVEDVARAFVNALASDQSIGQNYPLGGPRSYTLQDVVSYVARQLNLRRWIIPLPKAVSQLQAALLEYVPGKPFSLDNYRSLQVDSITPLDGLAALGVRARSMEDIVPQYLNPEPHRQRGRARHQRQLDRCRRLAGRQPEPPVAQ